MKTLNNIGITENVNEVMEYMKGYIKKGVVLDAGCGIGNFFKYFTNSFVVGLDMNRDSLKEIKRNKYILQGDITNLPFKSNSFDSIFSRSVLEYIKDPKETINEYERCLKPNGYLFITVPTKFSLFSIYRKLLVKLDHYYGPNVMTLFTPKYIHKLLEPSFKIEFLTGYDIWFLRYVLGYSRNYVLNNFLFKVEKKFPKWFLQNFAWEILCIAKNNGGGDK